MHLYLYYFQRCYLWLFVPWPPLPLSSIYLSQQHTAAGWCKLSSWSPLSFQNNWNERQKEQVTSQFNAIYICYCIDLLSKYDFSIFHLHPKHMIERLLVKQTYECMLFILCPKPVASWEEGIRICCIKPLKVAQVHTEPHLKETEL